MHHTRKYRLVVFLVLSATVVLGLLRSQTTQSIKREAFLFDTVSIEDGLSSDFILDIAQDDQGFLWFITRNGVNRYDGQSVVTFFGEKDSPYHPDYNWYHHTFVDDDGRLWLGRFGTHTDSESTLINWYNPEAGTFEDIEQLGRTADSDLHMDLIDAIQTDSKGMFIIGSRGLQYLDKGTQRLETIWPDTLHRERISTHTVSVNPDKVLWMGTGGDGIVRYDSVSDSLDLFTKKNSPFPMPSDDIFIVEEFESGVLWISETGECLSKVDLVSNTVTKMSIGVGGDREKRTSNYFALELTKDSKGRLWLGTLHNGIHLLNLDTGEFEPFAVMERSMHPHYFRANSIFEDRDGSLWVGTEAYGVLKIDSYTTNIGVVQSLIAPGAGDDAPIWEVVAEDRDGNVWAGSESSGLFKFDAELNFIKHFEHDPDNAASIHNNRATRLHSDPNGYMWVGTSLGASRIDILTDEVERITPELTEEDGLYSKTVDVMYRDDSGNVWIAQPQQLVKFVEKIGALTELPERIAKATASSVGAVQADRHGNIWLGASRGLIVFDPSSNELIPWSDDLNDPRNLREEGVDDLLRDSRGRMWGLTSSGVFQYNEDKNSFVFYDVRKTLSTGLVYGLAEDKWGQIWATTHKGVIRYLEETDSFSDFRRIETELGLPLTRIENSNTGRLILSNLSGVVWFDPGRGDKSGSDDNLPLFYVTRIVANNEDIHFGPSAPLPEIVLSPGGNSLTVDFSLLDFRNPDKTVFSYRIDELDQDWIYSNKRNSATYNQLPPGNYMFRVRGAGPAGVWSEPVLMQIEVLPYYWQTIWFRGLVLLLFVLSVVVTHRYMTNRIRKRNQELSEQVEFRKKSEAKLKKSEAEALAAKVEAEHTQRVAEAASEAKSLFLANMSHEIRTPLNAIMGMSELLRIESMQDEHESFIDTIQASSKHLLTQVEEILNYTQLESEKVRLSLEPCSLWEVVEEVRSIVRPDAITKEIELSSEIDETVPELVQADSVLLKQVLLNLLSNGVKYTNEGFVVIKLKVLSVTESEVNVLFEIIDSGVGIAEEAIERVFNVFEQEDPTNTREYGGVGLGLSIAKKLTELQGGNISVQSEKGKGSRFAVSVSFALTLQK